MRSTRRSSSHAHVCRQRRKQASRKSNGTPKPNADALARLAPGRRRRAAATRGDSRVKDKHNTASSRSRYLEASKSLSPPYRNQPIAYSCTHLHKTKPTSPTSFRLNRPLQTDNPNERIHPQHRYKPPQPCPRPTSAKGMLLAPQYTTSPPTNHSPYQAKQRLPRLPTSQSLTAALRDRRHLRQCARPACHRQHIRVLLQHGDQHQRQRAKAGSDGEPGKQNCRVQIGGYHRCDGGGALVDTELVLVRG